MICDNCGKENEDGSRFCNYCGQVFSENKPQKTENETDNIDEKPRPNPNTEGFFYKHYKKVILISVLALVISVVGIVVLFIIDKS